MAEAEHNLRHSNGNMNVKSNLDLIERLHLAYKALDKAIHLTDRTYGRNGPNKDKMNPLDKDYEKTIPLNSKQVAKVNYDLMGVLMAILGELDQFSKKHAVHYLEFPHQNKQMVKWFGNHHVTPVDSVEKRGNDLILHLGKKRKAVTGFLDVLGSRKVQVEPWSGDHMPKGLEYAADARNRKKREARKKKRKAHKKKGRK